MIQAIANFFKIVMFFLDLRGETNKKKAEAKAAIGKEIVDALKETNKARRASYLNAAVAKLRR